MENIGLNFKSANDMRILTWYDISLDLVDGTKKWIDIHGFIVEKVESEGGIVGARGNGVACVGCVSRSRER